MTITSLHFLRNLLLISTAVWVCLPEILGEGPVCDEESVYHYPTKRCFRVFDRLSKAHCLEHKGGEYKNESGSMAEVDINMEVFLRDYLQYLRIRNAVVTVRYYIPDVHPDDCFATGDIVYKYRHALDMECRYLRYKRPLTDKWAISIAEVLGTPVNWECVRCTPYQHVYCQANGREIATEESSCPSNVTVKSVSDSNVTLYITPGETKTQVKVRFSVYKPCINLTSSLCVEPVTSLDKKVFLVKPTTLTVLELEPSTRYRTQFEIDGYDGMSFKCNETFDFTTNGVRKLMQGEDTSCTEGVNIGLSVILACSLFIIVILATLYGKLRKSQSQDKTSQSPVRLMIGTLGKNNQPKEVTKSEFKVKTISETCNSSGVGTATTCSNVGKGNTSQNKRNNSHNNEYTNSQVTAPTYDEVDDQVDEHTYEM